MGAAAFKKRMQGAILRSDAVQGQSCEVKQCKAKLWSEAMQGKATESYEARSAKRS